MEDKFEPVRAKKEKGQDVEITQATMPGMLTSIDNVFYKNSYPVTAVIYSHYSPETQILTACPKRDGNLTVLP